MELTKVDKLYMANKYRTKGGWGFSKIVVGIFKHYKLSSDYNKMKKKTKELEHSKVMCICGSKIGFKNIKHCENPLHFNNLKKVIQEILFNRLNIPIELCNLIVNFTY